MSERYFDLNIEKILEGWEVRHAIRELIANALDEQVLSNTQDVTIASDSSGNWHIRDFGRGIRYEYLTQNENHEKLKNAGKVIGKYAVGLKDALAALNRRSEEHTSELQSLRHLVCRLLLEKKKKKKKSSTIKTQ